MGLPVGSIVGARYRVLARLGEGGMGSVYAVTDTRQPGSTLALKELLDDSTMSMEELAGATQRFDGEIALLARLRHPRIPAFIARFDEGSRRYFVMEYVPGMTLEERIAQAQTPLPERVVLPWMIAVCEVLAYLHHRQPPVILRDLKPANVMVTPAGDVRLIDFGIARTYKPGQGNNTENLGTAAYASPEHHGRAQTDARSDIYSLGATMYHLLTNTEPAPMETPLPGCVQRVQPGVSRATEQIILRAMALDPGRRYQSADDMCAALRTALAALSTVPSTPVPATVGASGAAPGTLVGAAPRAASRRAAAFPVSAPATRTAPHVASGGGVACPACGYRNRAGAKFCARDGHPLHGGATKSGAAPARAPVVTAPMTIPSTAQLHAQRASESYSTGRFAQAIHQGETAVAEGHATYDTYLLLGRAYQQATRQIEAADAFAQAARLRPTAEALVAEGVARREAGQDTQAQIAFARARQLDPRDAAIPYQLGLLCLHAGQLAQAEGELRDALVLRPHDVPALIALGDVLRARNQVSDAEDAWRQAIAADPAATAAYLQWGRALLAGNRVVEAARTLEDGVRHSPASADLLTALGMAYHALGRRAQARQALRQALALNPRATEAQRLLKHM